ncbi:helix-turn-helix transcriptional regulator [Frigoribacterium sp. 2-23]|uniref:helix-turn-helix transcriptional regulator n=1 Tax=Frigoribacterium sp. 2-23 TaxID=3415006 RepID=UPI003C700B7C
MTLSETPPDPVAPDSVARGLVSDHARDMAEVLDRQAVVLESVLAALRSRRLDDRAARVEATDIAASALVSLRTGSDRRQDELLEPVVSAFARLQSDLRPLVRFGDLDVQFVQPPSTGRALPGDVAHAARAIVRNAVLTLVDAGDAQRVRIQWDCDGLNLLIGIRDDGAGELTVHDDVLRPIAEQVTSLDGDLAVSSTTGWGSELSVRLPLDPPAAAEPWDLIESLSAREREVLRRVATGDRNHDIARTLGISDNTVKFHVSNLLRKLGARSRTELATLASAP